MKKTLFFVALFCFVINASAQVMELTPNGFIDKSDPSKNYVVIDIPNTPKEKIYTGVKKYINQRFNSPKFVTSEVPNEQLVIDALDSKDIKVIFRVNGSNLWHFNYKFTVDIKDNKIRFSPLFKSLSNDDDNQEISLIGISALGSSTGIFNKNGKLLREKAKVEIDDLTNSYIQELKDFLTKASETENDNW